MMNTCTRLITVPSTTLYIRLYTDWSYSTILFYQDSNRVKGKFITYNFGLIFSIQEQHTKIHKSAESILSYNDFHQDHLHINS